VFPKNELNRDAMTKTGNEPAAETDRREGVADDLHHWPDKPFLEVPVYRIGPDEHEEASAAEKRRYIDFGGSDKNVRAKLEQFWHEHHWNCWDFNEVVGWIRLFVFCTQLRGETFWAKGQRLTRKGRRRFEWIGKAVELDIGEHEASQEIFGRLIEELHALRTECPYAGRVIDLTCLKAIGPHVDWRALMSAAERGSADGPPRHLQRPNAARISTQGI